MTHARLGRPFELESHTRDSLRDAMTYARAVRDKRREVKLHHLMITAEGRNDYTGVNLNQLVAFTPERFQDWLMRVWSNVS